MTVTKESDPRVLERIERTRANATQALLDTRVDAGHWVGELSSSALSTATAVASFAVMARARPSLETRLAPLVEAGSAWLAEHANQDGGHGDTVDSPTNLSTTVLVWMAFVACGQADRPAAKAAAAWLQKDLGGLDAEHLAAGLARVYGDDRTFAVPILSACAIAGCFQGMWPAIPRLPFELAALPRGLFRFLGLPVVSYALPALIAIGQAQHRQHPTRNPLTRLARGLTRECTLATLERIQPAGGGFLEATPLTSFVVLSLVAAEQAEHAVVDAGLEFLVASARPDGSWPIDTNLCTWNTTLSLGALGCGGRLDTHLAQAERERLHEWLLGQQLRDVHLYTGAEPGGWAWTDLPGGVPDADDTAGALLALRLLREPGRDAARDDDAARAGLRWLVDLANRDGGMPTFCRGWGKLPFDRSAADLSAHALRAYAAWDDVLDGKLARDVARAATKARAYLVRTQRADGAWVPLWFGNQEEQRRESPLYGTSRVLRAAGLATQAAAWQAALARGLAWLRDAQAEDGGFGGAGGLSPSIEETALGLEALAASADAGLATRTELQPALERAGAWLAAATDEGTRFPARSIGLYFARLWYSERLYPVIFSVAALGRSSAVLKPAHAGSSH